MPEIIFKLTTENFDKLAVHAPVPIMIEFWSQSSPDNLRLTSIMESLAATYQDTLQFGSVNVEQEPKLAFNLSVGGLPSALLMQNGRIYTHIGGMRPIKFYRNLLDQMLKENIQNTEKPKKHILRRNR